MTRGKMFELASDAARTLMKKHGELRHPLFMFTTADGTFETVVVESDWMATDGAKDALCALMMMMTMRAKRADSYAYVSEIWITSFNMGKPTDPVVDIAEVVREGNRKYHEEYERHGWNPSVGGGRDDAVLVVVGDAQGSEQRLWTIARFPGKRKNGVQRVRDLIPKERKAEGAWGEGRFRDLLVDFAARKRQAH
jgi:hypothetical protein